MARKKGWSWSAFVPWVDTYAASRKIKDKKKNGSAIKCQNHCSKFTSSL
jgi:hypothetical protein